MLYFCSVEDIMEVIASSPRYAGTYDEMRMTVTEEITKYIRRDLSYAENITEYFNTIKMDAGSSAKYWLEKKNIAPGTVTVNYSTSREWSDDNVIPFENVNINHAKGYVEIDSATRAGQRALRISYSGGYKPVPNPVVTVPPTFTDVMQCPATLRNACLTECAYRLNKLLNNETGGADTGKANSAAPKLISGLLAEVAYSLVDYRRPLGALA